MGGFSLLFNAHGRNTLNNAAGEGDGEKCRTNSASSNNSGGTFGLFYIVFVGSWLEAIRVYG